MHGFQARVPFAGWKLAFFWFKKMLRSAVRTPSCQMVPVSRAYGWGVGVGTGKGTGKSMRKRLWKLPFSRPPFSFSPKNCEIYMKCSFFQTVLVWNFVNLTTTSDLDTETLENAALENLTNIPAKFNDNLSCEKRREYSHRISAGWLFWDSPIQPRSEWVGFASAPGGRSCCFERNSSLIPSCLPQNSWNNSRQKHINVIN